MSEAHWHCAWCGGSERHDRRRCRMAAVNRDPAFRARQAEAPRPAPRARRRDLSAYGRAEYAAARAEGFGHADAMEIALDAMAMATAPGADGTEES